MRLLWFAVAVGSFINSVNVAEHLSAVPINFSDLISVGISSQDDQSFRPTLFEHIKTRQLHPGNNKSSVVSTSEIDDNIRITFQLHNPTTVPLTNTFNPYVTCALGVQYSGRGTRRRPTGETRYGTLPPSLRGPVLNFTATVSTNLKILQIGDSVGVQLAQAFDEMAGCRPTLQKIGKGYICKPRTMLWEAWPGHDGRTIIPTYGGGISALWRMTALLSKAGEGMKPANNHGGGWNMSEVETFLSYKHGNETLQNFDVVVHRVMHGWMRNEEITHERLTEAVELSYELLRAKTVILMTVPFTNNILNETDMKKVNEINADMRSIANEWHLRENTGVKNVLVMEYGMYYNHVIWANGRHIGYNISSPLAATDYTFDREGPMFLYDRLQNGKEWKPSIPMICSDVRSLDSKRQTCDRNFLFSDGMHICPETMATR